MVDLPTTGIYIGRVARGFVSEDLSGAVSEEITTKVLYVHPDGSGTDGLTWDTAYTTINLAVAALDTDLNESTLIMVSAGVHDIAVEAGLSLGYRCHIKGAGKDVTIFRNTSGVAETDWIFHAQARVKISDCTLEKINNSVTCININGATADGTIIENVHFKSATDAQHYGMCIRAGNGLDRLEVRNCDFTGYSLTDHTVGIYLQSTKNSVFENLIFKNGDKGIQFDHADGNEDNIFRNIIFHTLDIGLDMDAGDNNIFKNIIFKDCILGADIEAAAANNAFIDVVFAGCTSDYSDNGTSTEWEETDEVAALQAAITTVDTVVDTILVDTASIDTITKRLEEYEQVLYVAKGGSNTDGLSWATAFTSIAGAIAAVTSTKMAKIFIGAGSWDVDTATYLNIDENVHIIGAGREITVLYNSGGTDPDESNIFYVTETAIIEDLTFTNVGVSAAGGGGVHINASGANNTVLRDCDFIFTDAHWGNPLTIGNGVKRVKIENVFIVGNATNNNGIRMHGNEDCLCKCMEISDCLGGILLDHSSVDYNNFENIHINNCTIGINADTGNYNHFNNIHLHNCTTPIDDEQSDNEYENIYGDIIDSKINPADLTGTSVTAKAGANNYTDSAVTVLTTGDTPAKIIGIAYEPAAAEKYGILLTDGTTDFFEHVVESAANTTRRIVDILPFWISPNTTIGCKIKSETGGNACLIWIRYIEVA